jgi:hypothetical protein
MTTVSYTIWNAKPEFDGSINWSIFQGSEATPGLTTLDDGSFALVYDYYPASFETISTNVFVNHFNADGSESVGAGGYGGSTINSYSLRPSVASLPGTNNFITVWISNASGSGVKYGISKTLGTSAGTGDFDGNGHSDIVWRNDDGAASIWDNGQMANAHIIAAAGTVSADWHVVA